MESLKIEQSFSKTGTPYDNAVVESFFSCLKREQRYVEDINNFEDLHYHLNYYIDFYNDRRPHQTLDYKTFSGRKGIHIRFRLAYKKGG